MKTYFLQVKSINKETEDAITIEFWHPISEQLKYKAGQFITISIPNEGKKIKRSYSMCSSPQMDSSLAVTVKKVHGGVVSNYLNDNVNIGDFLEVIEPMGTFNFEPDANADRNIVLIGAGSGITPLMSILKSALKAETKSKVFLVYGNRNENSIIFKNQLDELTQKYPERLSVRYILSAPSSDWNGAIGRIEKGNFKQLTESWSLNYTQDAFYLCGPVNMMHDVKLQLEANNAASEQIHIEKFNATPALEDMATEEEGLKTQKVKVNYDGSVYEFEVAPHQTILEAALALDIDLPYSCQAGMCTACMGKCMKGKIKMDEEEGLSESEISEGYVLTCVSHPLTEDVEIEID